MFGKLKTRRSKPAERKLLIITQNLPPVIDGVGDYATLLAEELANHCQDFKIAFLSRKPNANRVSFAPGAKRPIILENVDIYEAAPFYWKIFLLPKLLQTVRKMNVNVVHLHYVPQMYYRAGVGISVSLFGLLLRFFGIRLILTFHEFYIPFAIKPKLLLIGLIQRFSFFLMLIAAQDIVVTTNKRSILLRKWLFWKPRKASNIVIAPVSSNFPAPKDLSVEDKLELRRKWNLPDTGLILSFVGQLRWEQPDWLYSTLVEVRVHDKFAHLLLIGYERGNLPKNHPLNYTPNVVYTGLCSANDVSNLLSISDIYLLPLDDGVSGRRTALMAGLQYGLPIVSTTGHNTESKFIDKLPVVLAPATNREEFINLATSLALDPSARTKLGQEAQNYYNSTFSWSKNLEKQLHLFKNDN